MKKILLSLLISTPLLANISCFPGNCSSGGGGGGGVTSINGNTNAAQTIVGGTGISVSSGGGTTTITNTGGTVTGSGVANQLTKWSSSTALTSSLWKEDSNGVLSNQGSYKGLVSDPLINLSPVGTGVKSGFFTDATFNRVSVTTDSTLVAAFTSGPSIDIYDGFGTTNGMGLRLLGTAAQIRGFGASGATSLDFYSTAGSNESAINLRDSAGAEQFQLETTPNSNDPDPRQIYMGGFGGNATGDQVDAINISRGGGISTGAIFKRANALTVNSRADWTMSGTTTANATTAIVGSGTHFTNDVGDGDEIALSSAPTIFSRAIVTDDTHLTTAAALGNGTSQSIIRRQALIRQVDRSGVTQSYTSPAGNLLLGDISTTPASEKLTVVGNASIGSSLILKGSSSGSIAINAGTSPSTYSLILPAAQGAASTVLTNNGSGTLSWATGSSNPAAGLYGQLQYNAGGGSLAAVPNNNASDASGFIFPRQVAFSLPGPRVVQTDNTNWAIMPWSGKIVKAWAVAKTGPTGSSLSFNILKSTNNGSTFTSIWNATPSNGLNIAANAVAGNTTTFDTTTFNAGDLLRIDILSVGSTVAGSDISVELGTATQNQ